MAVAYRKYSNNLRYFMILDDTRFREVQIIGSKYQQFLVEAHSYPEKLFIQDLKACTFNGVEEISKAEFETLLSELKSSHTEIMPRQN